MRAFLSIGHGAIACLCLTSSSRSGASVVAQWNFETDLTSGAPSAGAGVSHTGVGGFQAALADVGGQGNNLSVFTDKSNFGGMQFGAPNPRQAGSQFSLQQVGNFPAAFTDGDLKKDSVPVGSLAQWTVETSVKLSSVAGYQTFVGVDGLGKNTHAQADANGVYSLGPDAQQADFYLQKSGATNTARVNFVDAAGYAHSVTGTTPFEPNTWYSVAATSDGHYLRLYVDDFLEGLLDMTASGSPNTSMLGLVSDGGENGNASVPYAWSLARGMYNNGHTDRLMGSMDDTRISDVALNSHQFLISVPEATSVGLLTPALILLRARRCASN